MRLVTRLRLMKRWIMKVFLIKEKSGVKVRIPFHVKLKYNLMGFTDFQYVIFDLKHNDHHDYISMWERYRLEDLDGEFASLLGQKLLFARTFGQDIHIPTIFGWMSHGRLVDPKDGKRSVDLIKILQQHQEIIAKPNHSVGGGKGIIRIKLYQDKLLFGDHEVNADKVEEELKKYEDYLFVQVIHAHEYSKIVYPGTANTMRIVTVMNDERNDAEVLFAFHRFGSHNSDPVDNMSKGGLFAYIDLESGCCGKAKQLYDIDKDYAAHPDTGAQIEGLRIPNWEGIIRYVRESHLKFPFYDFFAWDVVINEQGIPFILEINRGSDLSIQSLHPMRKDKLGQYMKKRGLLDNR